jgi:cytidylate kinase
MKMVVAGPGQSGTTSIAMALEHLGFNTLSQKTLFINSNSHANINGF